MSTDRELGIEHPQCLIDLYDANIGFTADRVHELVEFIDQCGDVDTGVTEFVDGGFKDEMLIHIRAAYRHGKDPGTFDDYAKWLRFPYEKDAFREHLRAIWDECIGE